jgi:hypothetical protein
VIKNKEKRGSLHTRTISVKGELWSAVHGRKRRNEEMREKGVYTSATYFISSVFTLFISSRERERRERESEERESSC